MAPVLLVVLVFLGTVAVGLAAGPAAVLALPTVFGAVGLFMLYVRA